MSISAALLLILAVVLTSGKPLPTGHFRGQASVDARPDADPVVVSQLGRIDLTIDPDGRAVLEKGGLPYEGRMTRSGDTLTMEILAVANQNIARQDPSVPRSLTFEVLPDGALRYEDVVLRSQPPLSPP